MAILYGTMHGELTLAEIIAANHPVIFNVGVRWYHPRDLGDAAAVPILEMRSIAFDDSHPDFPALRLTAMDGEKTDWYDPREWVWFVPQ